MITLERAQFMCMGALPPQDHPHVFCDMDEDIQHVCPYCSMLYRHTNLDIDQVSRDAATTGGNALPKDNPPGETRFRSAIAKRFNALPR
jgi:uncharacterized Zn-finger protein